MLGSPLLAYVLKPVQDIFGNRVWVVSGHGADLLERAFPDLRYVRQPLQLGTGHAFAQAVPTLLESGLNYALVLNGDCPLVDEELLQAFLKDAAGADMSFATLQLAEPGAYGRVVRAAGDVAAIVEARDYRVELHGEPTGEINAGLYLINLDMAQKLLPALKSDNSSGEYYLTDLVALAIAGGHKVRGISCGDDKRLLGINSPRELAELEEWLRARIVRQLLESGVVLHAPQLISISPFSLVEPGAELHGPCEILGACVLRNGVTVGPHCLVRNSELGANAQIEAFCHLDGAKVGPDTIVGPFARLRPGAELESGSHVGNFVELKNTLLGPGAKANHLSYLGDARIGAGVNIGAGTITCNYDGKHKYQTHIGDGSFIGSNSSLVAPVRIGSKSLVGAGSVITRDVPDDCVALGRSRQILKPRQEKE